MVNTLAKEEAIRLDALEEYEIVGSAPDSAVDEITALAREICKTPMAGVSIIGADSIYYLSRLGPGPARLPRGGRPCETAILGDNVYEISDARYHPDYRPDGIMVSGRAYRFYAGAPLTNASGRQHWVPVCAGHGAAYADGRAEADAGGAGEASDHTV